jgi:glycosyltransferase involved in cell wall biosynthesis
MNGETGHVWFWMETPSPHFAALFSALIARGVKVHVIAAHADAGAARRKLGWPDAYPEAPTTIPKDAAEIRLLLASAPASTVHICSRLDFYSISGRARRLLRNSGRKHWAILETIDDSGFPGVLKRLKYRMLIRYLGDSLAGVFAIGAATRSWLIDRGADPAKIFPFAYFVEQPSVKPASRPRVLRFCYVGQLIPRKRVDLLIEAFARAALEAELEIIGGGPEEARLRELAQKRAPGRVRFHDPVPFSDVPQRIASADYFVQPSRFDGWGAAVIEALMVGTPVLCSDACGSSLAVQASGGGTVFRHDDLADLERALQAASDAGRPSPSNRAELVAWSRCFSGPVGAEYLLKILAGRHDGHDAVPPWIQASPRRRLEARAER